MDNVSNTNLSADEMILANGAAEARETDRLRDTADRYEKDIEELKALYDKNSALVEELRSMNVEANKGIQDVMKSAVDRIEAANASIKDIDFTELQNAITNAVQQSQDKTADLLQQSDDFSHKENVRVYRNIQAATDQLLQKQTEELTAALEPLKAPARPKANGVQIATLIFVILGVAAAIANLLLTLAMLAL